MGLITQVRHTFGRDRGTMKGSARFNNLLIQQQPQ